MTKDPVLIDEERHDREQGQRPPLSEAERERIEAEQKDFRELREPQPIVAAAEGVPEEWEGEDHEGIRD